MTIDRSTLALPFTPGEWVDADEVMFQACFTILAGFVTEELGPIADAASESQYRGYRVHCASGTDQQAIDLFLWYRDELPALEQDYQADLRQCFTGTITTAPVPGPLGAAGCRQIIDFGKVQEPKYPYDHVATVKDQKLRELIEIRQYLWT